LTTTAKTTTNQKERASSVYGYGNIKSNSMIDDYIKSIRIMSKRTAYEYLTRLNSFNAFIKSEFGGTLNANDLCSN
jgi:hypothetical protein